MDWRRAGRRLREFARPAAIVVAVVNAAITAIGYTLATLGAVEVPSAGLTAIAMLIGIAAFLFVVADYQRALNAKLAPHELAAKINTLRAEIREVVEDAYKGPKDVSAVAFVARYDRLIEGCRALIAAQRPSYDVDLTDAIAGPRHSRRPDLAIGKNPHTLQTLARVEALLAEIVHDLKYP